jgi:esterase/lipase
MLPDPDEFCDCLKESFAELLAGAMAREKKPAEVVAMRKPVAAKRTQAAAKPVVAAVEKTPTRHGRKTASAAAVKEDGAEAATKPARRARPSKVAKTAKP